MRNNIPLILALSILIGLLTAIISTQLIFNDIQLKESPKVKELIIGKDTIALSPKIYNIPLLRVDDDKKKESNFIEKKYYLNAFPAVLSWIAFNCVALSLGMASILFILFLINDLRKSFEIKFNLKKSLKALVPLALVLLILVIFNNYISSKGNIGLITGAEIMSHFNIIFTNPYAVTGNVLNAFLLIGVFSLIGIMMVNISISKLLWSTEGDESKKKGFKLIKDKLNIFALYTGLLLGVAIIATRLQKNMIAEQLANPENVNFIYPDTFIYSYGISFTFILALFLLPSLVYLKYSESKTTTTNEENLESTSWWKIGKESIDDIKLIFAIVLPLISSAVQHFI